MDIFSLAGKITVNYTDAVKGIDEVSTKAGNLASSLGKTMQDAGQKISSVGKTIAPVSVAIGGALGASTKSASDFTDGMAKMSTLFDTTKVNVGTLSKEFIGLSNETGKSATELAEAGYQALSASVPVEKLGGFVKTSANLAKVGFTDTATAVDVMTTAINAYGMETEDADKIANNLVRTQNLGKTTVNELASSMGKIIPTASSMNVNLDNLCTAYVSLTKQGIATAEATTYANSMLNEMGDSGTTVGGILKDQTGKSFQELMADGYSLGDVLAILQNYANETGTNFNELWGSSEAGKAAIALLNGGADEFNNTLAEMGGTADLVGEGLKKLDTPSAKVNKALNQVKNSGIELGSAFLTALVPTITTVTGIVERATTWFSGLDNGTKTVIATVMALVAALSPVLIVGGKVISGIGSIITVVPQIVGVISTVIGFVTGTVIPGITAAVSAIGLVPIAITAVIAGIILLWNKCDWFREGVIAIWEAIKSAAIAAWSAIKDFLISLWDEIAQLGKTVFEGLASFLSSCWQRIQTMFTAVLSAISTLFTNVWNGIKAVVTTVGTAIQSFLTTTWNAIKSIISTVLKAIQTTFTTVWNAIKTVITTVVNAIKSFITTTWNAIKSTITNVLNAIKSIVTSVWNGIKSVVTSIINSLKSFITSAFNTIKTVITNVSNSIKNVVSTVWNAIKSTISTILNGIKAVVSNIWNTIKTTVSTVTNAIKTVISTSWNAIKTVVTTVVGAIQNFITAAWNTIKSIVTTVMSTIQSVISSAWNGVKETISNVISGIQSTISGGLEGAKNIAANVLGAIKDKFSSIFDGATSIVKGAIDKIKSFFNFSWSLPKIKLPHFSISGKFSLNPPSIPKFGVQWYAKAMRDGMIMNQPTIFGYNAKSNQLLAGGEAGSETVVGTESLMNMIKSAVASENGELISVLNRILEAITDLNDGLSKKFYEALLNMKFQINEREFARLVKAV